jgi:hypothetical protein
MFLGVNHLSESLNNASSTQNYIADALKLIKDVRGVGSSVLPKSNSVGNHQLASIGGMFSNGGFMMPSNSKSTKSY